MKWVHSLLGPLVFGTNVNSANQMLFKGIWGTNSKVSAEEKELVKFRLSSKICNRLYSGEPQI